MPMQGLGEVYAWQFLKDKYDLKGRDESIEATGATWVVKKAKVWRNRRIFVGKTWFATCTHIAGTRGIQFVHDASRLTNF